ncbi:hypothetical protein AGOR_G00234940 [Albula goreensis]|uniref:Uncharacterized protein n=1 Tax=Albula goreensis TaxID=1534307 RepID=A0A8T3CIJ9_9TELE|nr:hypothetical protein AGOR_G00234940 [Albula goreensis]
MATERPFRIFTILLLFGHGWKGYWGQSIDQTACLQLQLTITMMSCAMRFSPEYQMDRYKGCLMKEGLDGCMQCITKESSDGIALDADLKRTKHEMEELVISITLESLADCIHHDQQFIVECVFTLASERALSRITTVTKNYFQHPDYVDCWAGGTLTGIKECAEVFPESSFLPFGAAHKRRNKDFVLCILTQAINATVGC